MNEEVGKGSEKAGAEDGRGESSSRMLFAIALFKLVKAALLVALGVAALSLAHDSGVLSTLRSSARALGFSPHGQLVNRAVSAALGVDHRGLQELGVGTFVYAAVFLTEGTGLIFRKRWAEYLTTIVTASFVPFEVYEMAHKPSVLKGVGIAVNVVIVAYLVIRLWRRRHHADSKEDSDPHTSTRVVSHK
jgi:uncharacterized membrane protein (DUF2068 family)